MRESYEPSRARVRIPQSDRLDECAEVEIFLTFFDYYWIFLFNFTTLHCHLE